MKKAECVRQVANWSHIQPTHKYDKPSFQSKIVAADIPSASPKMDALFQKIAELDERDMKTEGKLYKHMIFSDIKTMGYGAKILMAGFLAHKFNPVYDSSFQLNEDALKKTKSKNVAMLCSTAVFGKPIGVRFRKKLLELFNRRPDNVYGELIRFIILDQGYKEGIDLFDLKYVHLFEPLLTKADEKQAVGRGTRFCGQMGLPFDPKKGWPLHVIRYEIDFPQDLVETYGANTMFDLYVKYSGMDVRKLRLANELEHLIQEGAVDAELTEAVHKFQVKDAKQKAGAKKKKKPLRAKPPLKKRGHEKMRDYIRERFLKYKWEDAKMENLCKNNAGGGIVEFSPTQDFVRHYFQPSLPYKGILLNHSVGTGKTCSAIAIASTGWETRGYTILWVTRHTLKADIWKNMYDQVCSLVVKQQIRKDEINLNNAKDAPRKYLSKQWMEPISFKQLSNLCLGKNDVYHQMVKRNGKIDPFRKTLLIIDEAHKLYATDVVGAEKPNVKAITDAILHSYETSKNDSVRVILMTATPYTSDPMDLMKLLNLLRPREESLPYEISEFTDKYLTDEGHFTEDGEQLFMDDIAGYISHLNREKDARQFAYPVYESVKVPLSRSELIGLKETMKNMSHEVQEIKMHLKEGKDAVVATKKKVKIETKQKKEDACGKVPVKARKECKELIDHQMQQFQNMLLEELQTKMDQDENRLKQLVKTQKDAKKKIKDENDMSQEYAMIKYCGTK